MSDFDRYLANEAFLVADKERQLADDALRRADSADSCADFAERHVITLKNKLKSKETELKQAEERNAILESLLAQRDAALSSLEDSYRDSLLLLEKRDLLLRSALNKIANLKKTCDVYRSQFLEAQLAQGVSEDETKQRCQAQFEKLDNDESIEYAKRLIGSAGADDETMKSISTVMSADEKNEFIRARLLFVAFNALDREMVLMGMEGMFNKDQCFKESEYPHRLNLDKIRSYVDEMIPVLAPGGRRSKERGWVIPLPKANEETESDLNKREFFRFYLDVQEGLQKFCELCEKQKISKEEYEFARAFVDKCRNLTSDTSCSPRAKKTYVALWAWGRGF
jgi:hypothetical protein